MGFVCVNVGIVSLGFAPRDKETLAALGLTFGLPIIGLSICGLFMRTDENDGGGIFTRRLPINEPSSSYSGAIGGLTAAVVGGFGKANCLLELSVNIFLNLLVKDGGFGAVDKAGLGGETTLG
jgi:hypothetical protein